MKTRILASLLAIAIAAPASASPGSLRDFQLPPPRPTSTPQVQGPVDDEGAVPVGPRVIATPTANPTPAPTSTSAPAERPVAARTASPAPATDAGQPSRPVVQAIPESARNSRARAPQNSQAPSTARASEPSQERAQQLPATPELGTDTASVPTGSSDLNTAASEISAAPATSNAAGDATSGGAIFSSNLIWWLIAFAAALAALVGAFAVWKRRSLAPASAPLIEAPLARTSPERASEPAPRPETRAPIAAPASSSKASPPRSSARVPVQIKAEAISLSRSMMNATLQYRLNLRNLGTQPLRGALVKVDVVTAHGKAPVTEQLANRDSELPLVETIADLAARDTHMTEAEFRLPVGQIRTIPQGKAHLYIPLLRVRIEAPDKEPLTRTFVIGMLPPEGQSKLQPFRLDEMAQTYRQIGLRALD